MQSLDEYQPQEAECSVYLSVDEKIRDAIRMRAQAAYGTTVYDLFDDVDPSSQYRDMQREGDLRRCLEKYFDICKGTGENCGLCTSEEKMYELLDMGFHEIRELAALFVDCQGFERPAQILLVAARVRCTPAAAISPLEALLSV